ncbi:ubiquitin carboxyl-terminal hydrolase 27 isoform X1 [Actinidia eriantha]|uniref:ubiquitin carboxyl-terminal hydrolase 27 isoform X1 n=2 Tax=Actinidia eriantha TaxID=165200 RepID=UPI00258A4483|nr:ubiquitin carboxyl-terminal hydrolase 27 isoform X1 [Actinidia eriantha]
MKIEGKLDPQSIVHKLKHGIGILSHVKWVSASGLYISLTGLLGVGGLILALRDTKTRNFNCLPWSSDTDAPLEKLWVVPGLQNLGNNCFLNVILQALASCSCFQSFLQKTMEEGESLLGEECVDSLPLTVSLVSLMEELCNVQHERMALSPRRLMLVMAHYISNFNLANQQDAEEAFFHILSSIREEVSSCYVPNYSALADVTAVPNCRILAPKRRVEQSELERWRQSFHGPFDGILGSNLTCESCSFQISLDFQFFHSLHLSPVLTSSANIIMPGCSVEDCMKKFFVAERLENYCCSHCWHGAAIKYLSSMDEYETGIGKLRHCCDQGSCDCKNLPHLKALPWSNNFSHTFKQLNIARSPKILCIHLQRASINEFGELVKLQGHISFPLILNLYPFMKSGVGTKNWEDLQSLQARKQHQHHPYTNHFHLQNSIFVQNGMHVYSKAVVTEELGRTAFEISRAETHGQAFQGKSSLPQSEGSSDIIFGNKPMQSDNKVEGSCHFAPWELHTYRLVSVVEHFGGGGSGHYSVYRRVSAKNKNDGDHPVVHWFCISDSYVQCVSEKDVLGAEASMLFYEKISE